MQWSASGHHKKYTSIIIAAWRVRYRPSWWTYSNINVYSDKSYCAIYHQLDALVIFCLLPQKRNGNGFGNVTKSKAAKARIKWNIIQFKKKIISTLLVGHESALSYWLYKGVANCIDQLDYVYDNDTRWLQRHWPVPTVSQPACPSLDWDTVCVRYNFFAWRFFSIA